MSFEHRFRQNVVKLVGVPAPSITENSQRRAPAWGADLPRDDAAARGRLLDAAEQCYADRGPSRTKLTHIAARAGVHRTTVYNYFRNHDEILTACYVRAADIVLEAARPCWNTGKPFLDQVVDACLVGLTAARELPTMQILIERNELQYTQTVASASEAWAARLREAFVQRLAAAAVAGHVRTDVSPETLARWVVRVSISVTAEPAAASDGGDEGVLRAFLPRCLKP